MKYSKAVQILKPWAEEALVQNARGGNRFPYTLGGYIRGLYLWAWYDTKRQEWLFDEPGLYDMNIREAFETYKAYHIGPSFYS